MLARSQRRSLGDAGPVGSFYPSHSVSIRNGLTDAWPAFPVAGITSDG